MGSKQACLPPVALSPASLSRRSLSRLWYYTWPCQRPQLASISTRGASRPWMPRGRGTITSTWAGPWSSTTHGVSDKGLENAAIEA